MRFGHIPLLIVLQLLFIILFAVFVDYDPKTAVSHQGISKSFDTVTGEETDEKLGTSNEEGISVLNGYPSENSKNLYLTYQNSSAVCYHHLENQILQSQSNSKRLYFSELGKWINNF